MTATAHRPPVRARPTHAAGRRASLQTDEFRLAVVEHLIHTCAKDVREASPYDLYQAFAHTVRDRLVHRWLATQRTYVERDAKRVYYLSSEFLTGRSLGLCLMNMGLYEAAEALAAERGLRSRADPRAGGRSRPRQRRPRAPRGVLPRLAGDARLPGFGYGIRYEFGIFEQEIDGGWQVERADEWLQLGNPWEMPRPEYAADGALRRPRRAPPTTRTARCARAGSTREHVLGVPYDTLIAGYRTDTVNTLRLWAARASDEFDLQLFNDGDYVPRRRGEERHREHLEGPLPERPDRGRAASCASSSSTSSSPARSPTSSRATRSRHETFDAVRRQGRHPAQRHAPGDRHRRADARARRRGAASLGRGLGDHRRDVRLHEPHAPARGARAVAGRAVRAAPAAAPARSSTRSTGASCARCTLRWPRRRRARSRACRSSRRARTQRVRMAHLASSARTPSTASPRSTPSSSRATLLRDFYELWPERFNNKTNGVTPRRWLLTRNPRLTQLITEPHRATTGSTTDLTRLHELEPHRRGRRVPRRPLAREARRTRPTSSRSSKRARGVDAADRGDVRRADQAPPRVQAPAPQPACTIVALYLRAQARARRAASRRAPSSSRAKAAPGYRMAKLHHPAASTPSRAVINADPAVRGRLAWPSCPTTASRSRETIIPAADLSLADLDRRQGGLGHGQHEVRDQRRAHASARSTAPTSRSATPSGPDNFFLFGMTTPRGARRCARRATARATSSRRAPALQQALELIESGFFSLGDRDRYKPILDNLKWDDPFMVCADFEAYVAAEARAAAAYLSPRDWSRRALCNIMGGEPLLERRDDPPVRVGDLGHRPRARPTSPS